MANNLPEEVKANFLIKEVEEDYTDPSKWRWTGDYDKGQFISVETEASKINRLEIERERQLFQEIESKYPLPVIMARIIKQIRILSKGQEDDEFKNMADLILSANEIYQSNKTLQDELHRPTT